MLWDLVKIIIVLHALLRLRNVCLCFYETICIGALQKRNYSNDIGMVHLLNTYIKTLCVTSAIGSRLFNQKLNLLGKGNVANKIKFSNSTTLLQLFTLRSESKECNNRIVVGINRIIYPYNFSAVNTFADEAL